MRSILTITILLGAAFAATSIPETIPASAARAATIDLSGCEYIESINQVPGSLVDPMVPDEFQVPTVAQLVVGMAKCDARADDGRRDEVTFGWADVKVAPRAGLRTPGISLYLWRIEHLAMDDLYGELHRPLGAQCRVLEASSVTVTLTDTHATGVDGSVSAWDIRVPAGVPSDGSGGETPYREYGPAEGGFAYLQGTLVDPGAQTLPGTFLVDEQSPLFDVWGPAWTGPVVFADSFAIQDTTIGKVDWPTAAAPTQTC